MDSKAFRFVLVTAMTSVMVLVVTLVATIVNLGYVPGFYVQWLISYVVSWPIAAATGFLVMPAARRFTGRFMSLIGAA